jgi:hypothetical protein
MNQRKQMRTSISSSPWSFEAVWHTGILERTFPMASIKQWYVELVKVNGSKSCELIVSQRVSRTVSQTVRQLTRQLSSQSGNQTAKQKEKLRLIQRKNDWSEEGIVDLENVWRVQGKNSQSGKGMIESGKEWPYVTPMSCHLLCFLIIDSGNAYEMTHDDDIYDRL